MLFVSTPLIFLYYSGITQRELAADQICIWRVALTEYMVTAGAMLVIDDKHKVCSSYFTYNALFHHTGEGFFVQDSVEDSRCSDIVFLENVFQSYGH